MMTPLVRAKDMRARQARANQILDAAADLLQRWGYKRVTIDDVAEQAGIGKGTIYLHWADRESLFVSVLEREFATGLMELVAAIRQDPETALLHRMTRSYALMLLRIPLIRAAFVDDVEMLGKLEKLDAPLEERADRLFDDYLKLLTDHGLLRTDIPLEELAFAYRATITGFFLPGSFVGAQYQDVPLERRADLLATVVQRAFEKDGPPPRATVQAIAPRVIALFTEMAEVTHAHLRQAYDRGRVPSTTRIPPSSRRRGRKRP